MTSEVAASPVSAMPGRGPTPTLCDHPTRMLCDVNDAVFCPDCDVWLETVCSDPDCDYCRRRPERPSLETRPRLATRVPTPRTEATWDETTDSKSASEG